jgi:hypothetical protein
MIKKFALFILFNIMVFSFEINDIRFDKGETISKEFTVHNSNKEEIMYKLTIEGDKEVRVSPNLIRIKKDENKKFNIEVRGKKNKGEYQYYLVVKQVKTPKEVVGEGVEILKTIKILQKYRIK